MTWPSSSRQFTQAAINHITQKHKFPGLHVHTAVM